MQHSGNGKNVAAVIGSGLAGTLISNELVKRWDVILLEAGPGDAYEYPKIDFIHKDFGVVKTCCIGAGGTTNLWHNGLIPLNVEDITSNEFRQVLREAEPFTDRAASGLHFHRSKFSVAYSALLSEMNALAEDLGAFPEGVDCLIYPKRFQRLSVRPGIKAFYDVSDIEFERQNNRVASIRYAAGAKHYSIKPDIVIVCAGALNTPYLVKKLLGDDDAVVQKIGTGFMDHPMGLVGKIRVKKAYSDVFEKISLLDKGDYVCRTAARLKSDCGRYTGCVFFRPALTMQNRLELYKYKSLLGGSKGVERFKNALSLKILHPDILAEVYSHLFGVNIRSRVYNILLIFEQKRGDSRVSHDRSGIKVDWCITEKEIAVYNGLLKKLKPMLAAVADDLKIIETLTGEWLWSAAHHSGTISLGGRPDDVVDKDLKLNNCGNVFVCDGSVIQEHSYANTGLTIGQLALRLAEHIMAVA
jgi:GMC oxidoreductase